MALGFPLPEVTYKWRFVRRNMDFYAEISEATVKNDNKQQKKNSYGKGKVSKNKVNPD